MAHVPWRSMASSMTYPYLLWYVEIISRHIESNILTFNSFSRKTIQFMYDSYANLSINTWENYLLLKKNRTRITCYVLKKVEETTSHVKLLYRGRERCQKTAHTIEIGDVGMWDRPINKFSRTWEVANWTSFLVLSLTCILPEMFRW